MWVPGQDASSGPFRAVVRCLSDIDEAGRRGHQDVRHIEGRWAAAGHVCSLQQGQPAAVCQGIRNQFDLLTEGCIGA